MDAERLVRVAGAALVLLSFGAAAVRADVLTVPTGYPTIQAAINAAVDGDRILVLPGTYWQRIVVEKDVVIESQLGPLVTVINAYGQGSTVTFRGVGTGASIAGFTITGGQGGGFGTKRGGGVWVDSGSPRIVRCIITGNDANRGGGVLLEGGSAEIRNCLITGNTGTYGPGINSYWFSKSRIVGCTITGNTGYAGGGLYLDFGAVTMVNSIVSGNAASTSTPTADNVSVGQGSSLVVDYSHIEGGPSAVFVCIPDCELSWGMGNVMADRLFVDPGGGDFHLQPTSTLIDGGDPAFVPLPSEVDLDGQPRLLGSRVDIGADEIFGDCNGNGIPDPVDTASGTSSDCNGNAVPDECEPDCNGNGQADGCDMATGLSADCNGNGLPDECDLAAGVGIDCDRNGVPDECEPDCNGNGITDACDIAAGTSSDACNRNGVPDECELDCINASTAVLYTLDGSEAGDDFGSNLGILGDVDGDGRDDVFGGGSGSSMTVFSGADGSVLYAVTHEYALSSAATGDVDGDGISDLVLGMPPEVQIHSGLDGALLQTLTGPNYYGWSVAGCGDVDGDGVPDVLVGAPRGGPSNYDPGGDGLALIHSGADGSVIRTLSCSGGCLLGFAGNSGAGDQFGVAVARAGDLDLDGHVEAMVGYQAKDCAYVYVYKGPGYYACFNQPAGVKVYSGIDGSLMFDHPKVGSHRSMSGVGDVDADGVPDYGTAGYNAYDGVKVFSGDDGSILLQLKLDADPLSDLSIARAGDMDGDGHDDLVVGAPRPIWSQGPGGGVFVLSGLDGRQLGRHIKPQSLFGYVVAGGGDLDGDGRPDFLAADPYFASYTGQVTALTLSR